MKRGTFIVSALALVPWSIFAKLKGNILMRTEKGFKVKEGEARFGEHFKMKGVTLNTLDIKISGSDTENELAVFEQTGLTPNGGPPLHIHLFQDEWFYVIEGEYLFQVGNDKYQMRAGDTIFSPKKCATCFHTADRKGKDDCFLFTCR